MAYLHSCIFWRCLFLFVFSLIYFNFLPEYLWNIFDLSLELWWIYIWNSTLYWWLCDLIQIFLPILQTQCIFIYIISKYTLISVITGTSCLLNLSIPYFLLLHLQLTTLFLCALTFPTSCSVNSQIFARIWNLCALSHQSRK